MVCNDADAKAALTDLQALLLTMWGEARGEPVEGRIAVGCVVRNRMRKSGRGAKSICLAKSQFSCWWTWGGQSNYTAVMDWAWKLGLGGVEPAGTVLDECAWLAQGLLGNRLRDRVKGATHYYSPAAMVPLGSVPGWAKGKTPVAEVGGHLFFRL
uniref:Putative cell wall hydrolase n=1 Tax=viral metagenome TaxID=1070528 RepID=A0A6M3J8R3_9ZZZZ